MSAKLTYNQEGKAMVFLGNNSKPWWWGRDTSRRGKEDIGYLYPDQRTAKEALRIISGDKEFTYSQVIPVYRNKGVNDYRFVVNDMTDEVISVVSEKYSVQQPSAFAEVIDKIFGNTLSVDTFGTLDEGRLLFCTTKVSTSYFVDGKDGEMHRMLTFVGSCDYTTPFRAVFSSLRTVCWNTFTPQLSKPRAFSVRHTPNMAHNIQELQRKIGLAKEYWDSLDDLMRTLKREPIRKEDADKFVKELFEYDRLTTSERTKNKMRDVYTLTIGEANRYGFNRAALVNGVTEFSSHPERRTHGNINIGFSRLAQEVSCRTGEVSKLVDRAFELVTKDLQFN